MHTAKARMHRPKIGHYKWVDPRKESRLENTEKGRKNKDKANSQSPPSLLNRETRKIGEKHENMQMDAMQCKKNDSCLGQGHNGHCEPRERVKTSVTHEEGVRHPRYVQNWSF